MKVKLQKKHTQYENKRKLSTFNFQLSPDKRLAVVILNWNGRALMEEFLPSVVACTPGEWADVIVADNGSTDDSIEMLKQSFRRSASSGWTRITALPKDITRH